MNGRGISQGSGPYDVIGASEGPDIGTLAPDSQSFLIRALVAHLDKLTAIIAKPDPSAPIEQVQFEVDASNIPGGGVTYHLPTAGSIVGYYLENNSTNTISIYAGASGASRALATAPAFSFKSSPIPQQITSVALVSSGSGVGLVRLLISSVNLGPAFGSLLGVSNPPQANITNVTTATATVCQGYGGGAASYLVGVVNNSLSAQTATVNVFDNASAASGSQIASIGPLGIGQVVTYPGAGIHLNNGATAIATSAPIAPGIQILTR